VFIPETRIGSLLYWYPDVIHTLFILGTDNMGMWACIW